MTLVCTISRLLQSVQSEQDELYLRANHQLPWPYDHLADDHDTRHI